MKEEDLYEGVKLYGTYVKTVKLPKTSGLADLTNQNTYIIYDHAHKRFYLMLIASSYRYIAIAEDLIEIY